jgi:hypothetical protein
MIPGVLYGRYSSHAQNDASIEQQFKDCREYCERNDIRVIAEYADRALTGTNDNRPEFQREKGFRGRGLLESRPLRAQQVRLLDIQIQAQ